MRFSFLVAVVLTAGATLSLPLADATTCATVAVGDAAVGIQIAEDTECANGGVGCIDSVCRFCRATNTTLSAHLKACTDIDGYVSPLTPVPTASSSGGGAIPLICLDSISDGDTQAGLSIVTDQTCSDRGVGCLDDICRLCRGVVTPQSQAYKPCSGIPPPPDLSDITFKPIPVFDDLGLVSSMDSPLAVADGPDTAPPEPSESTSTCSMVVSKGDSDIGLDIEADAECPSAGGIGCMAPPSVCKFCKRFETPSSSGYDDCMTPSRSTALVIRGDNEAAASESSADELKIWIGLAVAAAVVVVVVVGFAIVRVRRATSDALEGPDSSPATDQAVETAEEPDDAKRSAAEESNVSV